MNVSKYHNVKSELDGIIFASKKEMNRYAELKLLQQAGKIIELETQRPFSIEINGHKICKYIADFRYWDNERREYIVEDVKSAYTRKLPIYRLKMKLMKAIHGIDIQEI